MKSSERKYVLGESAAAALRPLLQRGAAFGLRPRLAHDPATAAKLRPFAVAVGEEAWRVYMPPETAEAVRFRGMVVPPMVRIGTAEAPWRDFVVPETGELYIVVQFREVTLDDGTKDHQAVGWTIANDAAPTPLNWPHLVAALEGPRGLVQYHLGSLLVGDPNAGEVIPPEEVPPCGHPMNGEPGGGEPDSHPLDGGSGAIGGNTSDTGHPLDGEGDGGFTPVCADDLAIDPLAA